MQKEELYQEIADHFQLGPAEMEELEAKFPDPKSITVEADVWDGHDIINHLDVPPRGNRSFVNDLLQRYYNS